MPSPFPGMDPWLESPVVWLDFHNRLANFLSDALNRQLPVQYYAQLEVRTEVTWSEATISQTRLPDVTIERQFEDEVGGGTAMAVAEAVRTDVSPYLELVITSEPAEVASVRIKDSKRDHEVVTAIEIVSPANKRPGEDRDSYLSKRKQIVESDTSLIEIDLLRDGERAWTEREYASQLTNLDPAPSYLVAVGRSWHRRLPARYHVFPVPLRDLLPVIPIPLRESEEELSLDLQHIFRRTYESGPYARGAVDYSKPADPPLSDDDSKWATARIEAWRNQVTNSNDR